MKAQVVERLARDLRGDEGVTVAIAAHPCAQREVREARGRAQQLGVESHVRPRLAQATIEHRKHLRKHRVQVVHDVPALGGHIGLLQEDLARPPQQREHRLGLLLDRPLLEGRPHLVLALHQQQIQMPMVLEDDRALGFGGVRGEHQIEAHPRQRLRDLAGIEVAFPHLLEALSPQGLHGREAVFGFGRALPLHRRVLLDHAEQVEGDRVGLRQPLG